MSTKVTWQVKVSKGWMCGTHTFSGRQKAYQWLCDWRKSSDSSDASAELLRNGVAPKDFVISSAMLKGVSQ